MGIALVVCIVSVDLADRAAVAVVVADSAVVVDDKVVVAAAAAGRMTAGRDTAGKAVGRVPVRHIVEVSDCGCVDPVDKVSLVAVDCPHAGYTGTGRRPTFAVTAADCNCLLPFEALSTGQAWTRF